MKKELTDVHNNWINKNSYCNLISPYLIPLVPDLGYVIKVNNMAIPQDIFPEEYEAIKKAYFTYLEKLKKLNKND